MEHNTLRLEKTVRNGFSRNIQNQQFELGAATVLKKAGFSMSWCTFGLFEIPAMTNSV
jgi:hypothetical protein